MRFGDDGWYVFHGFVALEGLTPEDLREVVSTGNHALASAELSRLCAVRARLKVWERWPDLIAETPAD